MASANKSTTDFSINHILNHAGERYKKCKISANYEMITSSSDEDLSETSSERSVYFENQKFIEIPNFNWLNYTRYNMPRLPRPQKGPLKRTSRLPRIPFTTHQLSELEKAYKTATYLSTEDANFLAKRLELTSVRVKIWFQNRRARDRRDRRENKDNNDSLTKILNNSNETDEDKEDEVIIS
ncbi:hypothetical protein PVAND_004016 [Polypedilum vanderplanki]|uniref:Homeobox domain-containing protein n=1 Tax=Polypedilum vanderplanki TaxID=319348 RepID=A0A9J6BVS6_POLVA|nr:hypothetical protein PVAND_004016 [Polypedilum vanderplanki]